MVIFFAFIAFLVWVITIYFLSMLAIDWQIGRYCQNKGLTDIAIKSTYKTFKFDSKLDRNEFIRFIRERSIGSGGSIFHTRFRQVSGTMDNEVVSRLLAAECIGFYVTAFHEAPNDANQLI